MKPKMLKKLKTQRRENKNTKNIASILFSSLNTLLHTVRDMEKRGISEKIESGEWNGTTSKGVKVKVKYSHGVKVGLDDLIIEKSRRRFTHLRPGGQTKS
jgi:hypothetical protein